MSKDKIVLVAGGCGFIGRWASSRFKRAGYEVWAIGHGDFELAGQAAQCGIDHWVPSDITLGSLLDLKVTPQVIVNASGSGSVGFSYSQPLKDFEKTVAVTGALLEYAVQKTPQARFIQLSSPAVYGAHNDSPIKVTDDLKPISPYGLHKKLAEDSCVFYHQAHGLDVAIIRFFSLYGPGLRKQLLWDAYKKIKTAGPTVSFSGTGEETRDWLFIDDAVDLILKVAQASNLDFKVLNGARGERCTLRETLAVFLQAAGCKADLQFSGELRPGDPSFYWADITEALDLGWQPGTSFQQGVEQYLTWAAKEKLA